MLLLDHLKEELEVPLANYQCDIDRSGECSPADALALLDLLNGANQFDSWRLEMSSGVQTWPHAQKKTEAASSLVSSGRYAKVMDVFAATA